MWILNNTAISSIETITWKACKHFGNWTRSTWNTQKKLSKPSKKMDVSGINLIISDTRKHICSGNKRTAKTIWANYYLYCFCRWIALECLRRSCDCHYLGVILSPAWQHHAAARARHMTILARKTILCWRSVTWGYNSPEDQVFFTISTFVADKARW